MRDQPKWAEALSIPAKNFDEWRAIAPDAESFTYWAMQTGRLSANDYLNWAKDHYELPVLSGTYFDLAPNTHLWQQIQTVANWSPWMLPLEEWDGVLFIACVEPIADAKWSFPVRYVLADAESLAKRWRDLHEIKEAPTKSLIRPEKTTVVENILNFESPKEETEPKETAEPADAPAGFTLNVSPSKPRSAPSGFDAFADLSANVDNDKLDISVVLETKVAMSTILETQVATTLRAPAGDEIPPQAPGTVTRALTIEPPPPVHLDSGGIEAGQGPERIDDANDVNHALAWCFRQLKTRFSCSLVLVHSTKGLQAWKWDASITPHSEWAKEISFEGPSLFRVAARTMRPYHGFVVENTIQKNFFKGWGFTDLPKHVTAIPISNNGVFKGLFLCIALDQAKSLEVLEFAEINVDRAIQRILKMDSPLSDTKAA
jgi:hypothetical protein